MHITCTMHTRKHTAHHAHERQIKRSLPPSRHPAASPAGGMTTQVSMVNSRWSDDTTMEKAPKTGIQKRMNTKVSRSNLEVDQQPEKKADIGNTAATDNKDNTDRNPLKTGTTRRTISAQRCTVTEQVKRQTTRTTTCRNRYP